MTTGNEIKFYSFGQYVLSREEIYFLNLEDKKEVIRINFQITHRGLKFYKRFSLSPVCNKRFYFDKAKREMRNFLNATNKK